MHRTFQRFDQVFYLPVARSQAGVHRDRCNDKWLFRLSVAACIQAAKEQPVHRALERVAGAPLLLRDKHGNVVVDGESRSHIMMLNWKAS